MENNTQFVSLFEFLGRAAGGALGQEVYAKAKELKSPTSSRDVNTKNYSGKVMLYDREFLNTYFNGK